MQHHAFPEKDKPFGFTTLGGAMFTRGKILEHWQEVLTLQKTHIQRWHLLKDMLEPSLPVKEKQGNGNQNEGNSLKSKSGNQSNGTKSGGKSSSKSGNTLTVGARRERSSSLANIYSRPRR